MDQIKLKARETYKKFDANGDGKVSMDEVTEGIKKGLGFGDDDEYSSSPSYISQVYNKYIKGKKDQSCMSE